MLEPIEKELAKRTHLATLKQSDKLPERSPLPANDGNGDNHAGENVNIVAKKVGLSPTTHQRAKTIIEKAAEELKEKVRSGETSIYYAFKQVKHAQAKSNPVKSCSRRYVAARKKQLHTV